jgi:hypothetical protein
MIYHLTAWKTGDIGGGLNAAIEPLPDDAWICARDGDTLFLTPTWGKLVEQIVEQNGDDYAVIGCMTNRLRAPYQLHGGKLSEEADIGVHVQIAQQRQQTYGASVQAVSGPVAGLCLIFRKATWARHPFVTRSIYFDQFFCDAARSNHGRVGVALGLYLFHLYRWGKPNPVGYVGHLSP